MWILTELVPEIKKDYGFIWALCNERKIKIGSAYCKNKFLGLCISDNDGDAIINEFKLGIVLQEE